MHTRKYHNTRSSLKYNLVKNFSMDFDINVKFSLLQSEHIEEVVELLNNTISFGLTDLKSMYRFLNINGIVALLDNSVIGFAGLSRSSAVTKISYIAVHSDHRKQGIGKALLHLISLGEDELFAIGWKTPNGWDAETIFMNEGFSVYKESNDYWSNNCDSGVTCPHRTDNSSCVCSAVFVIR